MKEKELEIMDAEDRELIGIMGNRFHAYDDEPDELADYELPAHKETFWQSEPVDWMHYLKLSCKHVAIFGSISLACFWGIQTGNMTDEMGWPIVYACTAVGAFLLGRNIKEAMK